MKKTLAILLVVMAAPAFADHAECSFIGEEYDAGKKILNCVYECKGRDDKVLAPKVKKDCPGSKPVGDHDH